MIKVNEKPEQTNKNGGNIQSLQLGEKIERLDGGVELLMQN